MGHGKPWNETERRLLAEGFRAGLRDAQIASLLDRTAGAVQMQRLALGLRHAWRDRAGPPESLPQSGSRVRSERD